MSDEILGHNTENMRKTFMKQYIYFQKSKFQMNLKNNEKLS